MTVPYYVDDTVTLHAGDCTEVMAGMADNSVDAVVTDPPAGIAFMARTWDGARGGREQWSAWLAEVMRECYRVAKPGAHALVWALPRTSHWTACGIEDAGWEIRDRIVHIFGQGFPKSLNLPGGLGTALKPATEDWWLARKPLSGTVAANVQQWGTGALNIDATRVAHGDDVDLAAVQRQSAANPLYVGGAKPGDVVSTYKPGGRWPPNVVLDGYAAAELDRQTGTLHSQDPATRQSHSTVQGVTGFTTQPGINYGDTGGASRFFPTFKYEAKAPASERPQGDGTPNAGTIGRRRCIACGKQAVNVRPSSQCRCDAPEWETAASSQSVAHPTVKPLDLIRWLARLVTPPGGLVLDPFAGSGTTGEAAVVEGFRCILIEKDPDYLPLIVNRLSKPIQPDMFGGAG